MRRAYFFLLLGIVLLTGAFWWGQKLMANFSSKSVFAGLRVETIPLSQVFLNEKELGKTPFESEDLAPGEYVLRLTPEVNASFSAWERKIKLNPGLLTYVNYLFGPTDNDSAGEILTPEKINSEKGELVVLSDPDGAKFSLDGAEQGLTPKSLTGFGNEEHELKFLADGYHGKSLTVKTWQGHKILINVKLAKIARQMIPVASVSATKVKILETPTGWLRVRVEPSVSATEAAKVKPGEEYPLLEENKDWLKIQLPDNKEGWVSVQYTQKVE